MNNFLPSKKSNEYINIMIKLINNNLNITRTMVFYVWPLWGIFDCASLWPWIVSSDHECRASLKFNGWTIWTYDGQFGNKTLLLGDKNIAVKNSKTADLVM
jgi:hypothetical protein